MDATIFDRLTLSPEATHILESVSTTARGHLADAVENFVLVSGRPVSEIADRLVCGYFDVLTGGSNRRLMDLIVDVLTDDDDHVH
jgi:hypothetical protein